MCNNRFDPVRCIMPPYIMRKMHQTATNTTETERLTELFHTNRIKADREFIATLPAHQQRILAGAAPIKVEHHSTHAKKKPRPVINIYDCRHGYDLPGKLVQRPKNGDYEDIDARKVHDGIYQCWKFYYELFKRDSIDAHGMHFKNTIHYGKRYGNAMWDGKQMIFGDGDGKTFKSFTSDLDIIGHEITHALVQFTSNFAYEFQPGALNESYADVFGMLIKQRAMNLTVKESDWLIGGQTMLGRKYALRSMKAPGTAYIGHPFWGDDPQPATMKDYMKLEYTDADDWGGVHWNSGIPNYVFYVTAMNIGGYAWKKAGKIWYEALTKELRYNSTFEDAKKATIRQAVRLFGSGSLEEKAVKHGWKTAHV